MTDVIRLVDVTVIRSGHRLLDQVTWSVAADERWVILGPNGAGKTTLLQIAGAHLHPTSGYAAVLGDELGAVDVFELRPRVGLTSAALADRLPNHETVLDVVLTASYAVLHRASDRRRPPGRARALLHRLGVGISRRGPSAHCLKASGNGRRSRVR